MHNLIVAFMMSATCFGYVQ